MSNVKERIKRILTRFCIYQILNFLANTTLFLAMLIGYQFLNWSLDLPDPDHLFKMRHIVCSVFGITSLASFAGACLGELQPNE